MTDDEVTTEFSIWSIIGNEVVKDQQDVKDTKTSGKGYKIKLSIGQSGRRLGGGGRGSIPIIPIIKGFEVWEKKIILEFW